MPTPNTATLQVVLNGGAPQTGVVAAAFGDSVVLKLADSSGVKKVKYRIYEYPEGFACPAGWTAGALAYELVIANGAPTPAFSLPASNPDLRGQYLFDVEVNGRLRNGVVDSTLYDNATLLEIPFTSIQLKDFGYLIDKQADSKRGWTGSLKRLVRYIDQVVISPGGTGDVVGPGSSTSGLIAEFSGATGKALAVGSLKIADLGLNVRTYGASPSASAAANVIALTAACAAAAAVGAHLFWPSGTYTTNATIPLLHTVRHRGPGAIQRGSDFFVLEPRWGDTNTLYASAAGTGDGLTSAQPMSEAALFAALPNYGPTLEGTWRGRFASGTYAGGHTVIGLRSRNRIELYGPDVTYGTPTAVFDGSGAGTDACGIYARNYTRLYVKDIKFQDYDPAGNGCGIAADEHSYLYLDNVHTTNCANGADVEVASRLYVKGGLYSGNQLYNIRAYAQCTVTIGHDSVAHRVQIGSVVNGGGAGVLIRDNSSGHIDYTDINGVAGSGGGVQILNQSRVHFVSCVFGGTSANYYNLRLDSLSTYIQTGCTFNAATARSIVQFGFSIGADDNTKVYFDTLTGFFRFGLAGNIAPGVPYLFQVSEPTSGIGYNSNVVMAIEKAGSPYLGFGSDATGSAGLMFARNGANSQGRLEYFHSNDTFGLRVNAVDAFKWHNTYYRPEVDNVTSLGGGAAANRWTVVYATTGAINTSDETEKEQIEAIPDAVLDAWHDVEWVRYKWRDAVASKGDDARWHYGAIAQRVKAAFEAHGLDPFDHGLLCYDRWDAADEERIRDPEVRDREGAVIHPAAWRVIQPARAAGERYGLRYEEALVLEAALMRRELNLLRNARAAG